MMWPVMAFGFVRKVGAASMTSLTQAFISLSCLRQLRALIIRHLPCARLSHRRLLPALKTQSMLCALLYDAAAIANAVGTILVGALVLVLPLVVLSFLAVIAAISGCIGGFIANMLLVRIGKIGFGGKINIEQK